MVAAAERIPTHDDRASLLIVDDEIGPAESLRMIFKPSYNVFTANSGRDALEIVRSTPIDVVTLDLRMPVMSGVEVMERIKELDPDIEIIVITGYSSLDSALRGIRSGVFDYITKPFDVPQISELVRRAVARRRATLRSQRLKEDFLANLSHELRTPLGAIIGYSSILLEELGTVVTQDQRNHIERIQVNSLELSSLIDGVLLLNSIDAGEISLDIRPFDIVETVRRSIQRVQPTVHDKGLLLRSELPSTPLIAVSDEEKVERVIWALLDNAVKFTAKGAVSVEAREGAQPGALEIEVSDTGIGMDRDELLQALQGLSQGDSSPRRRYRGLGLGLRIATRLVDLLGGQMRVRSAANQGTRFTVTLPPRPSAAPRLHS